METGVHGVHGALVALHVEMGRRHVYGSAPIRNQCTEGGHAKDTLRNPDLAILNTAVLMVGGVSGTHGADAAPVAGVEFVSG